MRTTAETLALAALMGALLGCGSEPDPSSEPSPESAAPPLPWPAERLPAVSSPESNPTTDAKIALGRLLFYDPILSTDRRVACATCHSEIWGLSDGLAVSVGIDGDGPTGPGRAGPNVTRRNSPTLWNVAYKERLFWDGRSDSLEDQALRPFEVAEELGRPPVEVATELETIPAYRDLFLEAFPESAAVTPDRMAEAIAAFERTFVSDWAPYDRYVAGDEGALSEASVRGMFLFEEVGCASCHVPPYFDSERYEDRDVPAVEGVADQGRFEATGDEADRGRFQVPTLRNLAFTEPYFHSGAIADMRDAVAHEAADGRAARPLTEAEIDDVTTFINKGLTDISRDPDRPDDVPSGLPVPVDGFRIPR